MASNSKGVDVRGEVVNLLVEKIASDRNPSVTMMNLVEELFAPDDVPAYLGVLSDKVQTERYPSLSMIRRSIASCIPSTQYACGRTGPLVRSVGRSHRRCGFQVLCRAPADRMCWHHCRILVRHSCPPR
jgi:hypothetical protein